MLRTEEGQTVKLEDYRPSDFDIRSVAMTVRLYEGKAEIDTRLDMLRRPGADAGASAGPRRRRTDPHRARP